MFCYSRFWLVRRGRLFYLQMMNTRQVSSMIHLARPIVTPVANIVFYCFVFLDLKNEDGWTCRRTDMQTDVQHVQKQLSIPTVTVGWPGGSNQYWPGLCADQICHWWPLACFLVAVTLMNKDCQKGWTQKNLCLREARYFGLAEWINSFCLCFGWMEP